MSGTIPEPIMIVSEVSWWLPSRPRPLVTVQGGHRTNDEGLLPIVFRLMFSGNELHSIALTCSEARILADQLNAAAREAAILNGGGS